MTWQPMPYTLAAGVAAGVLAVVAATTWRHRSERVALPFLALVVALAAWSVVYGVQLGFRTLPAQLPLQRVTLAIAGTVPTLWMLFTVEYAGRGAWLSRPRLAAVLSEPVAFGLLALTNPRHGLVWTDAALVATAGGPVPDLAFGPGYAVHIVYAYLLVGGGIALLVHVAANISQMYRRQAGLLIAGATPPFLAHVAFTIGVGPATPLDLTPFLFALTGVAFGLALFRFDLLARTPIARRQAISELGIGLVIVDTDGTVVDVDEVARAVLDPTPELGEPLTRALPDSDLASVDDTTLTTQRDGTRMAYDLRVSPIHDLHDQVAGHVLVLRDVTDRHGYQQRLEVTNRVLRHNLRNDANVITGFAGEIEAGCEDEHAADAREIRETAEGLLALSEKARRMTELDVTGGGHATIEAVAATERVLVSFRDDYPDVQFDLDAPPTARATVVGEGAFETAVRNVVENAIEHNDAPDPRVDVAIRSTDGRTRIEVTDNGPGIPAMEREVIERGTETPLHHSQGLGLWLASWVATASGGTVRFETGSGSTVTLEFPRPDEPGAE